MYLEAIHDEVTRRRPQTADSLHLISLHILYIGSIEISQISFIIFTPDEADNEGNKVITIIDGIRQNWALPKPFCSSAS